MNSSFCPIYTNIMTFQQLKVQISFGQATIWSTCNATSVHISVKYLIIDVY
jgi:hypothetical protein